MHALYARFAGARVESRAGHLLLVCPQIRMSQFNGVWADEDRGAAAGLPDAIAEVEGAGLPFGLQTRNRQHPETEREAERLGLVRVDREAGMAATADDLRERELPATDAEIVRVGSPRRREVQAVAEAGFEVPRGALAPFFGEEAVAMPGLSLYLAFLDDVAVATASGFVQGEAVGIFSVATPPEHRRRGYGAAVTRRAVEDGFALGAELAWLQASSSGKSVYDRLGFREVESYSLFRRPRADEKFSLVTVP